MVCERDRQKDSETETDRHRGRLIESYNSLFSSGPADGTQVVRLIHYAVYPLSHLVDPDAHLEKDKKKPKLYLHFRSRKSL